MFNINTIHEDRLRLQIIFLGIPRAPHSAWSSIHTWWMELSFSFPIAFPGGSVVQKPLSIQKSKRCGFNPLEEEMATHSSTRAGKTPQTEEPGGVHGVPKSRIQLSDWAAAAAEQAAAFPVDEPFPQTMAPGFSVWSLSLYGASFPPGPFSLARDPGFLHLAVESWENKGRSCQASLLLHPIEQSKSKASPDS